MLQLYLVVSNTSVSAILTREAENQQLPIYYVSKFLSDAETKYSSLQKLVLALVTAVKKLRHYFETHIVVVMTNYSIKSILHRPKLTGRMGKWLLRSVATTSPALKSIIEVERKSSNCRERCCSLLGEKLNTF